MKLQKYITLWSFAFLCLCLLAIPAGAASADDLTYTGDGDSVTITDCLTTASGELVIPDTLDGLPVTAIGATAFKNCASLTSVTVPEGVTSIGKNAFQSCTKLQQLTLPSTVTTIGGKVLYKCTALKDLTVPFVPDVHIGYLFGETSGAIDLPLIPGSLSLRSVTSASGTEYDVPDSLQSVTVLGGAIPTGGFSGCSKLTKVVLGDSVTAIGSSAFYGCSQLSYIVLGKGVTTVGENAFAGCTQFCHVLYTSEDRTAICVETGNNYLQNATWHENAQGNEISEMALGDSVEDHCSLCGKYLLRGWVDQWSLVLKDNIALKFQMIFSDQILEDTGAFVRITVADDQWTLPVSQASEFYVELAAAQLTDTVILRVVDGNGNAGDSFSYSALKYAQYILDGDYDETTQNLVIALLNYGGKAQSYFGYNTGKPANADITVKEEALPDTPAMELSGTVDGLCSYGATLLYQNKLALRFYFEAEDISRYAFTAAGQASTPVKKDGLYYVEISGLLPQDIDQPVTVTATDGTDTITVSYSPLCYITRMYQKTDSDALKALGQALYTYHCAAKAYSKTK